MAKRAASFIPQLSKALPKVLKLPLEEGIVYSLIQTNDYAETIGTLVLIFFIGAAAASILTLLFTGNLLFTLVAIPAGFFLMYGVIRTIFFTMADAASRQIEKVLPDMLLLMSANLRAGMIPESSFIASIKPEFGKLNLLLSHAAIEAQGGKDFRDAIVEMGSRTTSHFFKDTMRIIGEGLRSGAELHLILENLAVNILQNESIRNDMKSQVRSYSLFIFLASCIAAPLLYGVSSFLITILDNISSISSSAAQAPSSSIGLFSSFSIPQISPDLILVVSLINVVITTVSSAILNGLLNSGNSRDGLKYAPIFAALGIVIFLVVRIGVASFFSSSSFGSSTSSV